MSPPATYLTFPTMPSLPSSAYNSQPPGLRSLLRKTDLHLLPLLSLLFLLNSLDRSNIGNAESAGYTSDIGLPPEALNRAVAWFFFVFVALQPLGAAAGRRYGAHRWIPGVMVGWGVCTLAMIWVRTEQQLILTRIAIGALEAGFYPTAVSYLAGFYTRYEFAQRLALFYGQYAVAGALGGFLSAVVFTLFPGEKKDGPSLGGWRSWEVLFLVQGLATIVVAAFAAWWMPSGPGEAWWLEPNARKIAEERVLRDREEDAFGGTVGVAGGARSESGGEEEAQGLLDEDSTVLKASLAAARGKPAPLTKDDVVEAVVDWKVWYILAVNILSSIPGIAFSIFLPLVLKGLGATSTLANLLTVPPFLLGAGTLYLVTLRSDRKKLRLRYVLWGLSITTAGLMGIYSLVSISEDAHSYAFLKYIALNILLAGSYIASPLTIAWLSGNITSPSKRALVLGINGWGNLAGVIAPSIFSPRFAPDYKISLGITMVLVAISTVGYAALLWFVREENAWRARVVESWDEQELMKERLWGRGKIPPGLERGWWWSGNGRERKGERRLISSYGL